LAGQAFSWGLEFSVTGPVSGCGFTGLNLPVSGLACCREKQRRVPPYPSSVTLDQLLVKAFSQDFVIGGFLVKSFLMTLTALSYVSFTPTIAKNWERVSGSLIASE
jgi:hypothetical protein